MKMCNDCNVEMIDNCKLEGQHPFELGVDGQTDITIKVPTGEKGSFLGMTFDKENSYEPLLRVCPKCGKVEIYINPQSRS